jgi:hypothetical protein
MAVEVGARLGNAGRAPVLWGFFMHVYLRVYTR